MGKGSNAKLYAGDSDPISACCAIEKEEKLEEIKEEEEEKEKQS
jgi:hypothetical protein